MHNLHGKVALVTGATAGFGAAIAEAVVRAGGKVIASGRRKERLAALAARLGPDRVHQLPLDLTRPEDIAAAVKGLPAPFDAVDVLVNNAGLALGLEPAQRASLSDWETMIATNCRALVALTHAVLPGMVARGRGHVVNIGSVAATYPYPGGNVYGATKAFVRQFTLNLRSDLLGTGVRATVLEPGMAETEFSMVRFQGDRARAAKVYENMTPLSASDIAEAVLWVVGLPAHVNVNTIEMMATAQAFSPFAIHRTQG